MRPRRRSERSPRRPRAKATNEAISSTVTRDRRGGAGENLHDDDDGRQPPPPHGADHTDRILERLLRRRRARLCGGTRGDRWDLSLIHISEPTRLGMISY